MSRTRKRDFEVWKANRSQSSIKGITQLKSNRIPKRCPWQGTGGRGFIWKDGRLVKCSK